MATMACRRAGGLTRRGPVSSCISYATRVHREGGRNSQPGAASGLNSQQQQQQPCVKSVQQLGIPSRWDGFGNRHMISRSSLNPGSVAFLKPIGGLQFVRGYASDDLPPHQEIGMPSLSPTMTQGNIVSWKKKEGDQLAAGDVLCEIETDKATLEMESMEDGFLAKIIAGDGAKDIQVGQAICVTVENKDDIPKFSDYQGGSGGGKPAAAPKQEEAAPPPKTESPPPPPPPQQSPPPPPKSSSPPPPASSGGRIFASPAAKKLAAEKNVPLSDITGTGPEGHILKADVEDYLASGSAPAKKEGRPAATREAAPADEGQTETVAAHRMVQSKQTIPHYYLSLDTRVDKIQELVEQLNQSQGTAKGKKISIDDFVIKAAALATRKVPECNSSWTDDFVRQYDNVNISVAIQSEKELLIPVVKDVDRKGIATISEEIEALVEKAKSNTLKPSDCEGGTFSVTILGGTGGIKQFSAIIHPPQSCILAVGTTEKRVLPGLEKGEFVSGTFVTVTLSCDHRVVDGAIGALWLGAFKGYIEDPMTLLL